MDDHDAYLFQTPRQPLLMLTIAKIRNKDPSLTDADLTTYDTGMRESPIATFTDEEWKMLGGCIAANPHLEILRIQGPYQYEGDDEWQRPRRLTDAKMGLLFRGMARGCSLQRLDLSRNSFGINGIMCMVPFLKNARHLTELKICQNSRADTECFNLLVEALSGGPIELLNLRSCNVDDISALNSHELPNLKFLDLGRNDIRNIPSLAGCTSLEHLCLEGNDIEREGYLALDELLRNRGSHLKLLDLSSTGIGDEGAEVLAVSLKRNATLRELRMGNKSLGDRGCMAFLKLLCDATSTRVTYESNHTLTSLVAPISNKWKKYIGLVLDINKRFAEANVNIGRMKVIEIHLAGDNRRSLCRAQGNYCGDSMVLEEMEPVLPDVLAFLAEYHGLSELHRMLVAAVPYLMSSANTAPKKISV